MPEGSFAKYVDQEVINQITVRENKFGREGKVEYSPEDLEVIHGNTVWCLLRSGVDAPENLADRYIIPDNRNSIKVTEKYALASVLGGDQLTSSGLGKRAGIQLTEDSSSTFYNITDQGHKPRPGITGFTVKTLDTWGMILEANINIKVWSRDDLDLMDLVYFKPGFPAIFEWGHTLYFKPDGSVCKTPKPMVSNKFFFEGGKFEDLDELVLNARKEDCNREAVFGYITNFSWSFNHDGSFDCTLKILSKGAVLESIGVPSNAKPAEDDKQDDTGWWNISDYHRLLRAMNDLYESGTKSQVPVIASKTFRTQWEYLKSLPPTVKAVVGGSSTRNPEVISVKQALQKAISGNSDCGVNPTIWEDFQDCPAIAVPLTKAMFDTRKVKFYYVTLQTLCNIINCLQKVNSPQFYLETVSEAKYGHFEVKCNDPDIEMPSINPLIALKQRQVENVNEWNITKDNAGFKDCVKNSRLDNFNVPERILNIWVNFNVFVSLIEQQIRTNKTYRLEPVLREFLNEIQKAFGNVNFFDLHANSAMPGFWEIVDRSEIKASDEDKSKPVPVLNVSGLYNTVVDLKVTSDVSQDIVNEMCIAATAPKEPGVPGSENADECLVFWGENCKARWITDPIKMTKAEKEAIKKEQEKEAEAKKDWLKKLKKLYEKCRKQDLKGKEKNGETLAATDTLISGMQDTITSYQLDGEKYFKNQVKVDMQTHSHLHMGIIPYKMTLTMLGISRLYIGYTFKIRNGILPKKYDNWGYIITGIEHSVRNNQWFTTLTTNYYPVFPDVKQSARISTKNTEGEQSTMKTAPAEAPKELKDGYIQISAAKTSDNNTEVGDKRGVEVVTKQVKLSYYFNNGYSLVFRNNNSSEAYAAADIATKLAADDRIGYSQGRRLTLYKQLVIQNGGDVDKYLKQTGNSVAADTDCSAFCHTCYAATAPAKYPLWEGNLATTGTKMYALVRNGSWQIINLSSISSPSQLKIGDIIWRNGHVEMVTGL